MLYMQSFNIKEGRMKDFQKWIKENEGMMQKHAPKGWTYGGTHAYVLGFGRYHAATIWQCSKYGDFDAWREHDDATWNRLGEEWSNFALPDAGEAVLLREMSDTIIMEAKKPKK